MVTNTDFVNLYAVAVGAPAEGQLMVTDNQEYLIAEIPYYNKTINKNEWNKFIFCLIEGFIICSTNIVEILSELY